VDDDSRQSYPPVSEEGGNSPGEPEYDPEDDYGGAGGADLPEFPTTHELILKDHTKVISALTLDPSGARILSGSHDYDCKLWDFGGMDQRCKPFKSWEPAESYHVRSCDMYLSLTQTKVERHRYTISSTHRTVSAFS
jgi:WD40 repeat protein